jgi:hypothetical protein
MTFPERRTTKLVLGSFGESALPRTSPVSSALEAPDCRWLRGSCPEVGGGVRARCPKSARAERMRRPPKALHQSRDMSRLRFAKLSPVDDGHWLGFVKSSGPRHAAGAGFVRGTGRWVRSGTESLRRTPTVPSAQSFRTPIGFVSSHRPAAAPCDESRVRSGKPAGCGRGGQGFFRVPLDRPVPGRSRALAEPGAPGPRLGSFRRTARHVPGSFGDPAPAPRVRVGSFGVSATPPATCHPPPVAAGRVVKEP